MKRAPAPTQGGARLSQIAVDGVAGLAGIAFERETRLQCEECEGWGKLPDNRHSMSGVLFSRTKAGPASSAEF
jgi:hypothetical protein